METETVPNPSDYVTTTVRSCARCGADHKDLDFERMSNPFDVAYPFWALCPRGKGPILLSSFIRPGEGD